jgi:hypothetical protein
MATVPVAAMDFKKSLRCIELDIQGLQKGGTRFYGRRLKAGPRNSPEPTHVYHKVMSGAAEFSHKAQTTEIRAARSSRFARAS